MEPAIKPYWDPVLQHSRSKRLAFIRRLDEMGSGSRDRVVVGAWIELQTEEGQARQIAVFPGGDATILKLGTAEVQILSPSSPLLQPIMMLEEGDSAELRALGEVEILSIG